MPPMLRLIEYKITQGRSAWGNKPYQRALPPRTTVWCIEHEGSGRFYHYCYVDRSDAAKVMQRIHDNWQERDELINFHASQTDVIHVHKVDWSQVDG